MSSSPNVNVVVGNNIRALRTAAGMSQTDLADALGEVTGSAPKQQTIAVIERGTRPLRLDEAVPLAAILKVSLEALLSPDSSDVAAQVAAEVRELSTQRQQIEATEAQLNALRAVHDAKLERLRVLAAHSDVLDAFDEQMRQQLQRLFGSDSDDHHTPDRA